MGQMKQYFYAKLSALNYEMAIHEGDANRRLASQSVKIMLLPKSEVPEKFKNKYEELMALIESTLKNMPAPGLIPVRLGGIKNSTASKYLKLLFEIQDEMNDR